MIHVLLAVALMQFPAGAEVAYIGGHQPEPAPLKCGKYQHPVKAHTDCSVSGDSHYGKCEYYPGVCADDLHTVTEKEYQQIMERLKALEWSEKVRKDVRDACSAGALSGNVDGVKFDCAKF